MQAASLEEAASFIEYEAQITEGAMAIKLVSLGYTED